MQYAKDYAAAGVPLTYLGPSNEPDYTTNYDSMSMSPAQMASVIDVLGPTVKNSGLSTQVSCCAATGWPKAGQYAQAIEADPTALAYTAVATGHGYSGAPTSPLPGWNKPAWETEWSTFDGFNSAWDDGSDASGLTWAQHIYQGLTGANVSAYLYWWGSTPRGNGDNESLVQFNGSTISPTGRLWAFANYSRYIHPGALRIGASSSNGAIDLSAYKNTDGSLAIVALNTGSGSDAITYSLANTGVANGATVTPYLTNNSSHVAAQGTTTVSGGAFSATVPGRSLVTYVIPGGTVSGNTVTVTNPGSQSGTVGTAVGGVQVQALGLGGRPDAHLQRPPACPTGLSISSSGLITGTPSAAGTSNVTVTATDTTGASGSASFTWTINGCDRRRLPERLPPAGDREEQPVPGRLRQHQQRRRGHRPVDLQRPDQPAVPVRPGLRRLRRAAGAELRPGRDGGQQLHRPGHARTSSSNRSTATAASLWLPQQQSDGSWQFKNQNSGLCLDVYGAGSNTGQQLDQWPCKNAPGTNQDFNPR